MSTTLLFCFLIGFFVGLRSLTPAAITAWAAHLGWIKPESPLSWIGSTASVLVFSVLAVAELVADKLPGTPSRTAPPGLIARIVMGGFAGTCIALSGGTGILQGVLCGIAGGIAGTFAGYKARTGAVKALGVPDIYIALVEDLICIGGSLLVVSRF